MRKSERERLVLPPITERRDGPPGETQGHGDGRRGREPVRNSSGLPCRVSCYCQLCFEAEGSFHDRCGRQYKIETDERVKKKRDERDR